jgi:small subunit ribosomal protein S8
MNDTLANALSKILANENLGKQEVILYPASKLLKNLLEILKENQYIGDYAEIKDDKGDYLKVNLLGRINKCGVIKPRFSAKVNDFEKYQKRYLPSRDFGIIVMSTSKGLMTQQDSTKKKIGGRLIAYCY